MCLQIHVNQNSKYTSKKVVNDLNFIVIRRFLYDKLFRATLREKNSIFRSKEYGISHYHNSFTYSFLFCAKASKLQMVRDSK